MTQTFPTARFHQYSLPGAVVTEGKTESIFSRRIAQQLTFTVGGAPNPLAADEVFTITFPAPSGGTITVTAQGLNGDTLIQVAAKLVTAWNVAEPQAAALYTVSNGGTAVVTAIANSANTSIPATSFTSVQTPATHTITAAQTVASGGSALRMGLLYVYDTTTPIGPAVSSTPRRAWAAAPPTIASAVVDLRGVVGREINSTTMSGTFDETTTFDSYPAGQIGFGQLTEQVVAVVDPNSTGTLDVGSALYWVVAAGTNTTPGAVTALSDGGNTLRLDNLNPVRARVRRREETMSMGSDLGAQSVRLVTIEVWRAN